VKWSKNQQKNRFSMQRLAKSGSYWGIVLARGSSGIFRAAFVKEFLGH
jgi:hypothetical protein